jgi:glycosyltransferase involved in cell wall biosynthesis
MILVDDGSTDGSGEICERYARRDQRIVVLHQGNGGVSRARNVGLEAATGDYVSFVDSDDWVERNAYQVLHRAAADNDADIVYFEHFVNYGTGAERRHAVDNAYYGLLDRETALRAAITSVSPFCFTKLFARRTVSDLRFRESIHWGEDTLFLCEAIGRARKVFYARDALYHYVQSENSATRAPTNPRRLTGLDMADAIVDICERHYPRLMAYAYRFSLGITTQLLYEYSRCGVERPEVLAMLKGRVRAMLPRVLFSPRIEARQRLKFAVAALAPRWYCRAHDGVLRRSRDAFGS